MSATITTVSPDLIWSPGRVERKAFRGIPRRWIITGNQNGDGSYTVTATGGWRWQRRLFLWCMEKCKGDRTVLIRAESFIKFSAKKETPCTSTTTEQDKKTR